MQNLNRVQSGNHGDRFSLAACAHPRVKPSTMGISRDYPGACPEINRVGPISPVAWKQLPAVAVTGPQTSLTVIGSNIPAAGNCRLAVVEETVTVILARFVGHLCRRHRVARQRGCRNQDADKQLRTEIRFDY